MRTCNPEAVSTRFMSFSLEGAELIAFCILLLLLSLLFLVFAIEREDVLLLLLLFIPKEFLSEVVALRVTAV